jgi:nucleoside-diphosphate-sugar epimerase
MKSILITGATGQIGSELTPALRQKYGAERVVAAGHRKIPAEGFSRDGPYVTCDVRDQTALAGIVRQHKITTIYHLAALLSAAAEREPQRAWEVNVTGLLNVLEIARNQGCAVFLPSSIGAFGPSTPKDLTPQVTIQRPTTLYGVSKVTGELLGDYYHSRYNVDVRGVRYPGLISHTALPGGGTTDYAVEIFYGALQEKRYTCYLKPETKLDLMYMPDAIDAALALMEAEPERLRHRNAYNLTAMSLTPAELAAAIRKHIPDFEIDYRVDPIRQSIADSWPDRLDDRAARHDWGWSPRFDLARMTGEMLAKLAEKLNLNCPG